uniref:Uncharacterized protein n=1 Tax=Panagrolaimus superbus TaxID=310955 RepID=A0A914Y008_9BILA
MVLIVIIIQFCFYFLDWRDIHNAADPESKILKATAGNIPSLYNISNSLSNLFLQKYESNEVFLRIGILKNCKNLVTGDTSDLPENIGFVGDTAITAILTLTIALYAFNFVIALISLYAPKATYILPFSAFCGLTLIAAPIVIFIAYNNEIYMSVKQKILTPDYERSELKRLYDMSVHDYYISYRFPLIISYGVGFYIIVVAFAYLL